MALILNLRGPQGNPGNDGNPGANGADGATWLTGTGVPANTLGKDNDLYLRTDTGDVYKKVAGSWV